MGWTLAPEWQRDGLEQMEAPVNNLIHEKMGVTGPWMGFQIKRTTSGGWGSAGRRRIYEQGGFSLHPMSQPRNCGVKAFIPYKHTYIYTIFTGVCSEWMWIIIPELNDFAAHETDLTVAAGTSIKEGELHFETARMIQLTPLICQIRPCVPPSVWSN